MAFASTPPARNNTKIIGRNFGFMGLEAAITLVVTLLTSVFIARIIGPARLGYFNYILWLISISCSLGSLGIPLATFKYMAEFLGGGQPELARAVFYYNLRALSAISAAVVILSIVAVFVFVDPQYRLCSTLLVLSMLPAMVTFVPSQANTAAENSRLNTQGAFAGAIVYVIAVGASLLLGWNLVGISAGILISRCVELIVKFVPASRALASLPSIPLPDEIRKRMISFSGLTSGLLLVQIVVWDRSDVIFLKLLQPDIRQLAFFSVCFSVADRLVLPGQAFANALSATQMSEYGRDKSSLFRITSDSFIYLLMGALPIMVGMACIGGPFIRVVYGTQYLPAIPVFVIVAVLSIPKAILTPAQTLLYSTEDMGFVLKWGVVASLVNIALDVILIPHQRALGAAFANGITQSLAVAVLWRRVLTRYPVRLDRSALLRLSAATVAMAIALLGVIKIPLGDITKLGVAIPCGAIVFLMVARTVRLFQKDDRRRLLMLSAFVPGPARRCYEQLVEFIVSNSAVAQTSR
jgi:O-antigen/teichoic acid export membrane protein